MVKVLAIIVVMATGYLFYPFWDLYIKADPFAGDYARAETGFWTRNGCVEAAEARDAGDYRCRKRVNFNRFLGV